MCVSGGLLLLFFFFLSVFITHSSPHTQNHPASFSSHEALLLHFLLIGPWVLSPSLLRPGTEESNAPRRPPRGWNAATVSWTTNRQIPSNCFNSKTQNLKLKWSNRSWRNRRSLGESSFSVLIKNRSYNYISSVNKTHRTISSFRGTQRPTHFLAWHFIMFYLPEGHPGSARWSPLPSLLSPPAYGHFYDVKTSVICNLVSEKIVLFWQIQARFNVDVKDLLQMKTAVLPGEATEHKKH